MYGMRTIQIKEAHTTTTTANHLEKIMTKFHVVRLDYSICKSDGTYRQTHQFSSHRKLEAAVKALEKCQREYNCVDIVNDAGEKVAFEYPQQQD